MARIHLSVLHAPARVRAVALLLHGGPVESGRPDSRWNPAYLRMLTFGPPMVSRSHGHLAVVALQYRYQGWNSPDEPAVDDAVAALERIAARRPGCPVALVGHSMGGRVAMRVIGHPAVRAVVGIGAWLPPEDPRPPAEGRSVLLMHGTHDLIEPWQRSADMAAQLTADGVDATFEPLPRRGHNFLTTMQVEKRTADFVVERLSRAVADR